MSLLARVNKSSLLLVAAASIIASVAGCAGYQIGSQSLYRSDIKTVYVPMIESNSLRRGLGERLTEAVVNEIEQRTDYKVVGDARADSILTGRILTDRKRTLNENFASEPRDVQVDFAVQVHWVDRRGNLIGSNTSLPVSPLLVDVGQSAHFFPEAGQSIATAQQQAIDRLAKQIVSQMEMPW